MNFITFSVDGTFNLLLGFDKSIKPRELKGLFKQKILDPILKFKKWLNFLQVK